MKEWHIWTAATAAVLVLLVFASTQTFEAVVGSFAILAFFGWILIEFLNLTRWLTRMMAKLAGEPVPSSVDDNLSRLDRQPGDYANTRNAQQDRRQHGGS